MQRLNFPAFPYSVTHSKTGYKIFDIVRKKYVQLTQEEWVRQHLLHYLISRLKYPPSLLRLEQSIKYNRMRRRPDIVVYNRALNPWMLIECKAANVKVNQKSWEQIARYNVYFRTQLVAITNGIQHFCWQLDHDTGNHRRLNQFPHFVTDQQSKIV